jgi:hypothetical protein
MGKIKLRLLKVQIVATVVACHELNQKHSMHHDTSVRQVMTSNRGRRSEIRPKLLKGQHGKKKGTYMSSRTGNWHSDFACICCISDFKENSPPLA